MTHVSTAPQGTPGYLDPDYHQSYQLSDKSDVYSFGVVLMELITAKKAVDMARERREINLAAFAVAKIQAGTLDEIIDPYLKMNFDIESGTHDTKTRDMVNSVAELAFRCLAAEKDDRPCMKEVLEELRRIRKHGYGSDPPNLANHDASSDTRLFGSLKEGEYIELDISYGSVYNNNNKDTKPLITTEREQQNSAAPWRHSLTSEDDVWESVHSSPDHSSVTQIWHEINLVSCYHRCYKMVATREIKWLQPKFQRLCLFHSLFLLHFAINSEDALNFTKSSYCSILIAQKLKKTKQKSLMNAKKAIDFIWQHQGLVY
jgi:hypothetical protein